MAEPFIFEAQNQKRKCFTMPALIKCCCCCARRLARIFMCACLAACPATAHCTCLLRSLLPHLWLTLSPSSASFASFFLHLSTHLCCCHHYLLHASTSHHHHLCCARLSSNISLTHSPLYISHISLYHIMLIISSIFLFRAAWRNAHNGVK